MMDLSTTYTWDEVTEYNWKDYLTEEDIERELILDHLVIKYPPEPFNIVVNPVELLMIC